MLNHSIAYGYGLRGNQGAGLQVDCGQWNGTYFIATFTADTAMPCHEASEAIHGAVRSFHYHDNVIVVVL